LGLLAAVDYTYCPHPEGTRAGSRNLCLAPVEAAASFLLEANRSYPAMLLSGF
jgi:hypothetical protein